MKNQKNRKVKKNYESKVVPIEEKVIKYDQSNIVFANKSVKNEALACLNEKGVNNKDIFEEFIRKMRE